MIKILYWSSCEVSIILVRFYWKFSFLQIFSKNNQVSYFMKIHPVRTELLHVDGQTDMTKLIAFLAILRASLILRMYRAVNTLHLCYKTSIN